MPNTTRLVKREAAEVEKQYAGLLQMQQQVEAKSESLASPMQSAKRLRDINDGAQRQYQEALGKAESHWLSIKDTASAYHKPDQGNGQNVYKDEVDSHFESYLGEVEWARWQYQRNLDQAPLDSQKPQEAYKTFQDAISEADKRYQGGITFAAQGTHDQHFTPRDSDIQYERDTSKQKEVVQAGVLAYGGELHQCVTQRREGIQTAYRELQSNPGEQGTMQEAGIDAQLSLGTDGGPEKTPDIGGLTTPPLSQTVEVSGPEPEPSSPAFEGPNWLEVLQQGGGG